ncbi:MAG TPA: family 16 glycoside hydrolase [Tepidisphaeraceae bacterium]|nr:family 16 glycoside hydrolase [Tepidisphaeraceae bacterium]
MNDETIEGASTQMRLVIAAGILLLLIALAAWVVFIFLGPPASPPPPSIAAGASPAPQNGSSPAPQNKGSLSPPVPLPPGMTRIFDGETLSGWLSSPASAAGDLQWSVRDGILASNGLRRGVLFTQSDYARYRIIFDVRQISGNHPPCVLIFCTRPPPGGTALDALAGVQFQPTGGHWDYRPGHNNGGRIFFRLVHPFHVDIRQWSRVEILADAARGTARMAVAQPVGSKAVEVLDFRDPAGGKVGPFAFQMHNRGLLDEYANVAVQVNPAENDLITTK